MTSFKTTSRGFIIATAFIFMTGNFTGITLIDSASANIQSQLTAKQKQQQAKKQRERQEAANKQEPKQHQAGNKKKPQQASSKKKQQQANNKKKQRQASNKKKQRQANNKKKQRQASNKRKRQQQAKNQPPKNQPPKNQQAKNTVQILPIRDLGTDKGLICFRVQAYSNTSESALSNPVCTTLKSNAPIQLAWTETSNQVIGYKVYHGPSENRSKNLLTDIVKPLTGGIAATLDGLL